MVELAILAITAGNAMADASGKFEVYGAGLTGDGVGWKGMGAGMGAEPASS